MHEIEMNYIMNILQGGHQFEAGIDWYSVFGFTQLNKIGGFFYHKLKERGIEIPERVQKLYTQILDQQADRSRQMGEWATKIGYDLDKQGISYAFLKGTILAHADFNLNGIEQHRYSEIAPYYQPGERVSNDIDILVAPKDIGRVENALLSLGFVQGYYNNSLKAVRTLTRREILERRMNRGETVPFQMLTNNVNLPHVEVDINFSLDYLPNGTGDTLNEMLKNGKQYAADNGGTLRSLEEVDFLIHLLLHQYKEMRVYSMVMRGKDLELYKLLDIYLMIKQINQRTLWNRILHFGVNVQAAAVFKVVKAVFDMELSDEIKAAIECLDDTAEFVVAPDQKDKRYIWISDVMERLKLFDHTRMLVEK